MTDFFLLYKYYGTDLKMYIYFWKIGYLMQRLSKGFLIKFYLDAGIQAQKSTKFNNFITKVPIEITFLCFIYEK